MDTVVVDLSHWNPTPDWAALKDSGVCGVNVKATEGTSYVDEAFHSRYGDAIAAGLAVSTYHFFKAGSVEAQMNHYLNTVKPRDGERMCIDHEEKASLAELEQAVAYMNTDSRNLQISVYSGHLIKDQLGNNRSDVLAGTSLWIAHYTTKSAPTWPTATWPTWSLWQFTDAAKVAGISQPVDGNRFNGSSENCVKWIGPPKNVESA